MTEEEKAEKPQKGPDDLDAVRVIVNALEPFNTNDRERIIRWAREKLGLGSHSAAEARIEVGPQLEEAKLGQQKVQDEPRSQAQSHGSTDIKTFIHQKNPKRDVQFAAAVAYYHCFEAPEADRKEVITGADLQQACRKAGRDRLKKPGQTLFNAHYLGYLDKGSEQGTFRLNAVGENLVAMTLPEKAERTAKSVKTPKRPPKKAKKSAKVAKGSSSRKAK